MNHKKENITGLTSEEVIKLKKIYGKNEITPSKKDSPLMKILHALCEPMFLLLIIAASIYFLLGEPQDGIIMLVFVFAVIAIDIFQEWKTDKTISALKKLSTPHITVLRDNKKVEISSLDLLPGDLMYIHEGIKIPADGHVLESNGLKVDESILTGESLPVYKTTSHKKSTDYWRQDYCYQGTLVISGTGLVKVDKIGSNTEYGQIGDSLKHIEEQKTPLQNQISFLVKTCSIIALILFLLVSLFTFISLANEPLKSRIISSILSGITLAMAMIPEEFPVVLTVFLGVGAWRLAKKKSLVKKLSSVETLGAISILCVDKTGTITKNKMTIAKINTPIDESSLIKSAILCCEENPYDPMEKAIYKYANNLNIKNILQNKDTKIKKYPFTDEHKMMASAWQINNKIFITAKGSPESIIKISTLSKEEKESINKELTNMQNIGLRVIAVSSKEYPKDSNIPNDISKLKLNFIGLIGFIDPPKDNISSYISTCKKAGIKVVMITGDNGITASAIASEVGIPSSKVITGEMLEKMSLEELQESVTDRAIFSRVLPKHKKKIITAYQNIGHIVAMTGDGVNDAAALKQANIGIAMGDKGSEVSTEAADLILLDDNFSTIINTIEDGRRIYDNIKKSIGYILTIHLPIALSSLLASILGINPSNFMLLPLHVVLLELIIDPTCSIIFEREPAESNIMSRPPRTIKEKLLDKSTLIKSLIQGLIIFLASFITYLIYLKEDPLLARTMAFTIIILSNIFLVEVNSSTNFAYQNIKHLLKDKVIITIHLIIIISIILINYTSIHTLLKLTTLNISSLLITILISFLSVYWYELVKLYKKYHNKNK